MRLRRAGELAEVLRGLVDRAEGGSERPTWRVDLGAVAVPLFVVGGLGVAAVRYLL